MHAHKVAMTNHTIDLGRHSPCVLLNAVGPTELGQRTDTTELAHPRLGDRGFRTVPLTVSIRGASNTLFRVLI
jgi:hypothetical protein